MSFDMPNTREYHRRPVRGDSFLPSFLPGSGSKNQLPWLDWVQLLRILNSRPASFADALTCSERRCYEEINLGSFDFVFRIDIYRRGPATRFHAGHSGLQQGPVIESNTRQTKPRNVLHSLDQRDLHRVRSSGGFSQSCAERPARSHSRATEQRWGKPLQ